MTDLFICSHLSELLLHELLQSRRKVVVCFSDVARQLEELGISPIVLDQPPIEVPQRDRMFFEAAMPGKMGEEPFPGTELPAWKVLGIDRLRFWYNPNHERWGQIIDLIDFDRVFIPLALDASLPWLVAKRAKARKVPVTAVKVAPMLNNPTLDFLRSGQAAVQHVIVSSKEERAFFSKRVKKIKFKVSSSMDASHVQHRAPASDEVQKDTLGIYFSPEYDWKFLAFFPGLQTPKQITICMKDLRAWDKFISTFPELSNNPEILLSDVVALAQCEEVLLPAYLEEVLRIIPENVNVSYYDIARVDNAHDFRKVIE